MEHQFKSNKWQIVAKFAIIYALVVIGFGLVLYLFNLTMKAGFWSGVVSIGALCASIYFAIVSQRDTNQEGFISYKQGLALGFYLSLIAGIILSLYQYVFNTYIAPEMAENIMNEVKRQMIEKGNSEEEMEAALGMMKKMQNPLFTILGGIFGTVFIGFIVSLVMASIAKREDPDGAYRNLEN